MAEVHNEGANTLLLTADDRTGALEAGGAIADLGWAVRFLPLGRNDAPSEQEAAPQAGRQNDETPNRHPTCRVLDLASRHCDAAEARRRVVESLGVDARYRCHKMDSGLRGNWAHDVAAFVAAGHRVAVVPSFPDAGRRCVGGTMFIHDQPVAESAFGRDPRNRLPSSRPADYLAAAGCAEALARGHITIPEAGDNAELQAAGQRALAERRLLVGTTGGIGAYVAALAAAQPRQKPLPPLPRPALVVCGSLHPLSRQQAAALPAQQVMADEQLPAVAALARGEDVVLTTRERRSISDADAEAMAGRLAATTRRWLAASGAPTLIVLGGDTAEAILGDTPLAIRGSVDVGVPLCAPAGGGSRDEGGGTIAPTVVTKGGGIGAPDTLIKLLPSGPT